MKVNWKTHPNNIGHFYFQGCFRCHDGNHVSKDGKVISKDCNSCHTVIEQQESGTQIASLPAQPFKHPVDIGDLTGGELLRLPQRRRRAVRRDAADGAVQEVGGEHPWSYGDGTTASKLSDVREVSAEQFSFVKGAMASLVYDTKIGHMAESPLVQGPSCR